MWLRWKQVFHVQTFVSRLVGWRSTVCTRQRRTRTSLCTPQTGMVSNRMGRTGTGYPAPRWVAYTCPLKPEYHTTPVWELFEKAMERVQGREQENLRGSGANGPTFPNAVTGSRIYCRDSCDRPELKEGAVRSKFPSTVSEEKGGIPILDCPLREEARSKIGIRECILWRSPFIRAIHVEAKTMLSTNREPGTEGDTADCMFDRPAWTRGAFPVVFPEEQVLQCCLSTLRLNSRSFPFDAHPPRPRKFSPTNALSAFGDEEAESVDGSASSFRPGAPDSLLHVPRD